MSIVNLIKKIQSCAFTTRGGFPNSGPPIFDAENGIRHVTTKNLNKFIKNETTKLLVAWGLEHLILGL